VSETRPAPAGEILSPVCHFNTPTKITKPNPKMSCNLPHVGIIVGHHPQSPGAHFEIEGVRRSEFDIWFSFARELSNTFDSTDMNTSLIQRPNPRPDKALGRVIMDLDIDFGFELHFNAVEKPSATGTLMIHRDGHGPSIDLASIFQKSTTDLLGLKDRATFGRSDLGIMRHTPDDLPLILCEPAFGSNPSDVVTMLSRLPGLMRAYREASKTFANDL